MPSSNDNSLIKKPYLKESYTPEQLQEFARCADPVTGPEYFLSNYFWVQHPTKGKIKYAPYDYQKNLIHTYHNYRLCIAMLPRQAGKSVTAAGYLLWNAMFHSDQTILIAAHKFSGAQEIMTRVRFAYETTPDYIRAGAVEYNKQSVVFDNGSRIVAQTTTETTSRGMSLSILYSDELAFVRNTIAREFWTSCSMTLSTGGKAIITSTPSSDEDLFAEIWNAANTTEDEKGFTIPGGVGVNGFKAFRAYWYEHPDRDDAWAAEQREMIGPDRFKREMDCEFYNAEETLISAEKLLRLSGVDPIETMGSIRWYKKPEPNRTYIVALDPSFGTGGDPAAIQILEAETKTQIGEWCHNKTPIEQQVSVLKDIVTYLSEIVGDKNVYYSVENNSVGEAILVAIRDIGEESIPGIFLSEPVRLGQGRKYRKGFCTTSASKRTSCAKLKQLIESDKLILRSKKLVSELKTFVPSGNSYAAKIGETDDLVLSTILAIRMLDAIKSYIEIEDDDDIDILLPFPFLVDFHV